MAVTSHASAGQDGIALCTCFSWVAGVQRHTDPLLGEVRPVDGEMAPPGTVVIPEVMVGIAGQDTDGDLLWNPDGR